MKVPALIAKMSLQTVLSQETNYIMHESGLPEKLGQLFSPDPVDFAPELWNCVKWQKMQTIAYFPIPEDIVGSWDLWQTTRTYALVVEELRGWMASFISGTAFLNQGHLRWQDLNTWKIPASMATTENLRNFRTMSIMDQNVLWFVFARNVH